MAEEYGVKSANWKKITNIMSPGNLTNLGISNYGDVANCLGIGQQYEVLRIESINTSVIMKIA